MVFSGLVTAWRLATCPTRRSPVLVMATTEGVVRAPSWLGITTGSPPCSTLATEFVVPKSMPIILLICLFLVFSRQDRPFAVLEPSLLLAAVKAWRFNQIRRQKVSGALLASLRAQRACQLYKLSVSLSR